MSALTCATIASVVLDTLLIVWGAACAIHVVTMVSFLSRRLQFVLGTESGMITSIVRRVEGVLKASGRTDVKVEIVFPVSNDAISTDRQMSGNGAPVTLPNGLAVVPGAASGEQPQLGACPSPLVGNLLSQGHSFGRTLAHIDGYQFEPTVCVILCRRGLLQ